jgi:hypothetical protein
MASQVEVEYTAQGDRGGHKPLCCAPPIDLGSEIHILGIQFFWDTLRRLVNPFQHF